MKTFSVVGNPIAHSLSPEIHRQFAACAGRSLGYEKQAVCVNEFEAFVRNFFEQGGQGLNITSPFKEKAFALSVRQTERAKEAKSANTLWMEDGQLMADNTDGVGFMRDLENRLSVTGKTILFLGAGGGVRGLLGPLWRAHPKKIIVYNRTLEKAERLKKDFPFITVGRGVIEEPLALIIQATSGGMPDSVAFSEAALSQAPLCYDLAYAPSGETPWVLWAKKSGLPATDGFGLLVYQALGSFFIWHDLNAQEKKAVTSLADAMVSR